MIDAKTRRVELAKLNTGGQLLALNLWCCLLIYG